MRAVVVRDGDVVEAVEHLPRLLRPAADRGEDDAGNLQRARSDRRHEALDIVPAEDAGRHHPRPLPDRVPSDDVRLDPDLAERGVEKDANRDRSAALLLEIPGCDLRRRKAELLGHSLDAGLEDRLDPGEEEGDEPALRDQSGRREEDAVAAASLVSRLDGRARRLEPLGRGIDDGEAPRAAAGGPAPVDRLEQTLLRVGGEHEDLLFSTRCFHLSGAAAVRPVRVEDDVPVDPAEAEGVDAGASQRPFPRLGLADDAEPRLLDGRMRILAVEARRQHTVVDGQRRLDQAGGAGGRHRVADHRLHRSEPGPLAVPLRRPEEGADGGELGRVARGRRSAVRLDQADGARLDPGGLPRALEAEDLALDARRHQARVPAVARDPRAADDGVDSVAVALGLLEPLENDDADPLAGEQTVGGAVEGPDLLRPGERTELAEHAPEAGRMGEVDGAGDDQVGLPDSELAAGEVDGDERARTGRIDRVRRSAEVEPVGDARRGQVGDEADRRVRAVAADPRLEVPFHGLELVLARLRNERPQTLDELLRRPDVLLDSHHPGPDVVAAPEDHARPVVRERPLGVPGVVERAGGRLQCEELVGFGALCRHRHHAEADGVEVRVGVDEAAPFRVQPVGPGRVAFEVDGIEPAGRGVRNRVDPAREVPPERLQIGCAREDACHPDDCDAGHAHSSRSGSALIRITWASVSSP